MRNHFVCMVSIGLVLFIAGIYWGDTIKFNAFSDLISFYGSAVTAALGIFLIAVFGCVALIEALSGDDLRIR